MQQLQNAIHAWNAILELTDKITSLSHCSSSFPFAILTKKKKQKKNKERWK